MKLTQKLVLLLAAAMAMVFAGTSSAAEPGEYTHAEWRAARRAAYTPWHGNYAYTAYGRPVALVVPPTAHMQSSWSWGVGQTTMRPIYHQFGRGYPGYLGAGGTQGFMPTPWWPSHTDQFGVYYVRGPW